MPNITQRDFSAGWNPGDDKINGRENGLLQMDNVDLDTNGALSLIGGTAVVGTAYSNNLHSLYSRTMNGTRVNYSADTSGGVFRDNTSIGTGGSTSLAAFSSAFDYTIIASGDKRYKDNGTSAVNLGVGAPTVAPVNLGSNYVDGAPYANCGSLTANYVMFTGTASVVTDSHYPSGGGHSRPASIIYLQVTADGNGTAVAQTYNGGGPFDMSKFTPPIGSDLGNSTDNDALPFLGYTDVPQGVSLEIDILLTAGNAYGDQMNDYYSYKIDDLGTAQFDPYTGVFYLNPKRSDFTRVGSGVQNWSTTYGFRITFKGTPGQIVNFLGYTLTPTGGGAALVMFGGTNSQSGIYQFAQVNVNNTGTYLALSAMGPVLQSVELINSQAHITPQNPSDAQVNEVWIFARSAGGQNSIGVASGLDKWYRVGRYTSSLSFSRYIDIGDIGALELNITYNDKLASIASGTISDPILSIVGPIAGRWFYFTKNLCYPSAIDNPDLVDVSRAIRLTGSNNEVFLWAKQVDKATVLVGTSIDVYVLSGTFSTFPDFTIDVYYHGMGCKYPPITYDAEVYAGSVYYMANDGWRVINAGHDNILIVAPGLDKLYKGIDSFGYVAPNLKVTPGSVRFPVCVAKNKLWCFITGTNRCEVFDFTRKYWRTFNYNLGDVGCVISTQDGQVLAFYKNDKKLRELDIKTSKLIDGATKQTVQLLWTIRDGQASRNRKDTSTFKSRIYTKNDSCSVTITSDLNTGQIVGTLTSNGLGIDKYIDLSTDTYVGLCKTYQVQMLGIVGDFLLEDWSIDFELRPTQVSFHRGLSNNFGSGSKKRVRNWPYVIDTLGNDVLYTHYVDNVAVATTTLNSTDKSTKNIFFTTDVFGVDYGYTLHCSTGLFEPYGELNPTVVQTLPIAKRFDQVGPEEFFKYGKIKQIELRVMPLGGSSIPYVIYMSDTILRSGNLNVIDGKEDSYLIDVSKGTSGKIARITFGPTSFDFHRFYVRLQVADSGKDTELNWITVANG